MAGDPAGYWSGTQAHVWARGRDGKLMHWWHDAGGVHRDDWGAPATAGTLEGRPVAYTTRFGGEAQQDVFGRGSDGNLYHWAWSPSAHEVQVWSWGGGDVVGDPAGF